MTVESRQAPLPEQKAALRGVEVAPTPIPSFNGENTSEIHDAFVSNLNLVSGGEVTSVNGELIQTDGILGSAKIKIDTRLEQIALTGEALAAEKEQFGKGRLRGPRAVRQLEQASRRVSQADNRLISENRKRVREQEDRIKKLCKEKHITADLKDTYNNMIAVEEYLANANTADLQPIWLRLEALKWIGRTPTRERIEDLLNGARTAAQGYDEYKALRVGQGEDENKVKGLRDFSEELYVAEDRRNENAADIKSRLEAARAKAQDWEKRNAEFKDQDTPEQRKLKTSHALIKKIEDYLGPNYIPDSDKLAQVGVGLVQARENLAESRASLAKIAGIVGRRTAKAALGIASRQALGDLEKKVADLEKEQHRLVDPVKRLTQEGAPKELKSMVKKVQAKGFDMAKIAPRERILAETVSALLGKGVVAVEKQSTEEETPLIEGEIPEVVGPSEDEMPEVARLADLGMSGSLTVAQLQNFPVNPEAQGINDDNVDPRYFGTLETDLKTALEAAERGKPGISQDDLSELIVDALRRTALHLKSFPSDQLVSFTDIKSSIITQLHQIQNPAEKDSLDKAMRLLKVAEIAYGLKNG